MTYVTRTSEYRGSVHRIALAKMRQGSRRRGKWLFLAALACGLIALAVWLFVL